MAEITEEMVEKALAVWWQHDRSTSARGMRAALLAVLPDIERAVLEEYAKKNIVKLTGGGIYYEP